MAGNVSGLAAERCCVCGRPSTREGEDGDSYCDRCLRDMEPYERHFGKKDNPRNLCRCGSGLKYEHCCLQRRKK